MLNTLNDAVLEGKRVLLRTSLNIPIGADGRLTDEYRLRRALPTLQYLSQKGCKVIVVGYFGRSGETLEPVAKELARLAAPLPVRFFGGTIDQAAVEVEKLSAGECLVLENMRTYPGEEANDALFAKQLAHLADMFVGDAFAEAHRAYASNVGVTKFLPSYAGFLITEEVEKLSHALTPPHGSLAVVGGAKFETKIPLLKKLLQAYDGVLLGGALANDMLKARGLPVGASLISNAPVPTELAGDERIMTPTDLEVVNIETHMGRSCPTSDTRAQEKIVDVGPDTARAWSARVAQAKFVLWNGPLGVYEDGYTDATDLLAEALVASSAKAVIGGGDTDAALAKFAFDSSRIFVSTGGGAMLEFLAQGTLPGIEALKNPIPSV